MSQVSGGGSSSIMLKVLGLDLLVCESRKKKNNKRSVINCYLLL
jgi:hypothetical protein